MSYTDNAPLITAWDNRVQALKDIIETLYDGSSTKVVIEDTSEANVLLSSMSVDSLTLDSNEQAPIVTLEAPQLVVEPEEDSDDQPDQEEEKEDTVDETVEETVDGIVEEPSEETEEEEETVEDTEEL